MKLRIALLGICVLVAANAKAQETPTATATSLPELALSQPLPAFSLARTPAAVASAAVADPSAALPATPDPAPQGVYGVHPSYAWQISAGYTFMRLYLLPHHTLTMNGVNVGLSYFPGGGWIGADGQVIGLLWGSSIFGDNAKGALAMGGPRFRWIGPRNLELWGHALVGMGHELPQVSGRSQTAFAYEAGGGMDIVPHGSRFAVRAEADMVGTRFFGTYQYSPQVSLGVVYKF